MIQGGRGKRECPHHQRATPRGFQRQSTVRQHCSKRWRRAGGQAGGQAASIREAHREHEGGVATKLALGTLHAAAGVVPSQLGKGLLAILAPQVGSVEGQTRRMNGCGGKGKEDGGVKRRVCRCLQLAAHLRHSLSPAFKIN